MELFVFDIDGTLTDSVALHQASYLHAYSMFDIPNLNSDWNSYANHSDSWIFGEVFRQNFGRDPSREERALFSSALNEHFDASIRDRTITEIPGAKRFLGRVVNHPSLAYAFATGSLRQPALRKLEALGASYPTELLVTASEFETREEIVREAIRAAERYFGVDRFEKIVSFGDGYWDFVTAGKLGIGFVGIAKGEKAEKLRNAGATSVHNDFLVDTITGSIGSDSIDLGSPI